MKNPDTMNKAELLHSNLCLRRMIRQLQGELAKTTKPKFIVNPFRSTFSGLPIPSSHEPDTSP